MMKNAGGGGEQAKILLKRDLWLGRGAAEHSGATSKQKSSRPKMLLFFFITLHKTNA
jgi:hypothetical protein